MTSSREDLAERLRKHLSLSEPRSCKDLLALAGISIRGGIAQTAGLALVDLQKKGLAKQTTGAKADRSAWLATAPSSAGPQAERVELPELDATLTLTTTTARPFGAPTDRTTLAITCALGPSWPEGVHVPGWSTGLFASQVAQGGLGGAKANGLARMRAVLSTLRADPTRDLSPTPPEVPVSDPDLISALLSYCAGVAGGAKDSSVHSWLKARRVSRIRAEELLEQLVSEGRLQLVEKPIAGGEVVVRYLPAEAVEPAPLPKSDAPPEEPAAVIDAAAMVEEALPLEEPVLVAGAAEPCQECDRLRQERDMAQGEAYGLRQQLQEVSAERDEARARCAAWEQEADHAYRQLCRAADLEEGSPLSSILERVRLLIAGAQAYTEAPPLDPGAIAHYLLDLPEERWTGLGQARKDLSQGRRLTEHGARLQAEALAAVDRLLSTPASASAPSPELVPDPIPLGEPIPAPPPSEEQPSAPREPDRSSVIGRALAWLRRREQGTPSEMAVALEIAKPHANTTLVTLTNRGLAERIAQGVYRAREQGREAAE